MTDDGHAYERPRRWQDAIVDDCVASLPGVAASVDTDRSGDERSGFSATIDIRPRNPSSAWIGGGIDAVGEFRSDVR